jgi:hypothetical protein
MGQKKLGGNTMPKNHYERWTDDEIDSCFVYAIQSARQTQKICTADWSDCVHLHVRNIYYSRELLHAAEREVAAVSVTKMEGEE